MKFRGRLRHISSMSTLTGDELNEMEVCCPAPVNTDPVLDSEAWTDCYVCDNEGYWMY